MMKEKSKIEQCHRLTNHICPRSAHGCCLPRNCLCHEMKAQLNSLWSACQPPVSFSPTHDQTFLPGRRDAC
ncbi:hypothetical protein INR49_014838 [Caranx melampygus]|nr:hypothetical protein INR49_014838 [Caranx melampygus]